MDLFLSFLVPLSVILNTLVIVVVLFTLQRRNKRKVGALFGGFNLRNILILSLAVSDVLASVLGFTLELSMSVGISALCMVAGFTVSACSLVSMIHLVALSLEVCLTIKLPFHARLWFKRRPFIIMVITFVWAYGVILAIFPLFGWGHYTKEGLQRCSIDTYNSKTDNVAYNYTLLGFGYVLPVMCAITCFALIRLEFKKMSRSGTRYQGRNSLLVRDTLKRERSAMLMFGLMVFSFVLAWTPYAICLFYQQHTGNRVSSLLIDISSYFGKSSTIFNPIIYSIIQKNFNTTMKTIFCRSFCCKRNEQKLLVVDL